MVEGQGNSFSSSLGEYQKRMCSGLLCLNVVFGTSCAFFMNTNQKGKRIRTRLVFQKFGGGLIVSRTFFFFGCKALSNVVCMQVLSFLTFVGFQSCELSWKTYQVLGETKWAIE